MHGSECAVGIRKIVSDGLEARHTIGLAVLEGAAVLEPRWRRLIIGGVARLAPRFLTGRRGNAKRQQPKRAPINTAPRLVSREIALPAVPGQVNRLNC